MNEFIQLPIPSFIIKMGMLVKCSPNYTLVTHFVIRLHRCELLSCMKPAKYFFSIDVGQYFLDHCIKVGVLHLYEKKLDY